VTPLDTKLHRGTKFTELTVHLAGYADVTSKIDLGGDFSKDVTLKTPAEAAEPAAGSATGSGSGSGNVKPDDAHAEEHHPRTTEHKPLAKTNPPEHEREHETHKQTPPPPPKPPKCQLPGPNLDPFVPVCKPGEKP
jgi:hypothetical protein